MLSSTFLIFLLVNNIFLPPANASCSSQKRATAFNEIRRSSQLTGYSIQNLKTATRLACSKFCQITSGCVSFNYCGGSICEVNSATIHDLQVENDSLFEDENCVYVGIPNGCNREQKREVTPHCDTSPGHFEWSNWNGIYIHTDTATEKKTFESRKCLDKNGRVVSHSNCNGCFFGDSPVEWITWERKWYQWGQAREYCHAKGGTLFAELDGTNAHVLYIADKLGWQPFLLGFSDEHEEGVWVSERGQLLTNQIQWDVARSQPNNKGGDQHYLVMFPYEQSEVLGEDERITKRGNFACNLLPVNA